MANITTHLNKIKNAIFGSEIRDSIHDAIQQCYDDASAKDNANMEVKMARGEYENLGKRLDSHSSQIKDKANQIDLETQEKRIDNLVSVGNGVDNAETADIRIGYDGNVYSSAGNAVRKQIENVYKNITDGINNGYYNYSNQTIFESGGINSTGANIVDNRYIRTKSYLTSNVKTINISDSQYYFILVRYDTSNNFVDRTLGLTTYTNFDYITYKYKIVLYNKNNTEAIDTNYYKKIEFVGETIKVFENVDKYIKPNTINQFQTSFLKRGKNMLCGQTTEGAYVDWQEGNLVVDSGFNCSDFEYVTPGSRISLNHHNALAFYDSDFKFIAGINGTGTKSTNYTLVTGEIEGQNLHGTYTVPSKASYMRVTFGLGKNVQLELGEESTDYEKPHLYINQLYYPEQNSKTNKFVKQGTICTITTKKAKYIFKKVIDDSINLSAWRLYEGKLIDDNEIEYTMWSNSDAEGAIQIVGEEDFLCGYHGDELFKTIDIIVDGKVINIEQDYDLEFKDLTICSVSDVYHCNTSNKKGIKAFERTKLLRFKDNKVTISNRFKCLEALNINRASLALFQCHKTDSTTGKIILTKFSNNNDLKLYDIPNDTGDMPEESKSMTQAIFYTNFGTIDFKINKGFESPNYSGYITNFSSQNRMKIYFDYIKGSTQVNINDILQTEFEFDIY